MKILKFTIHNYKALRGKHEFEPNGSSFFLIAGNGQGKTSAGKALIDILTKRLPSRPVTEGEKIGFIEFQLDDGSKLYAKLFEGEKPRIEFLAPDGSVGGSPAQIVKQLAGNGMAFSINDFLSMSPQPRREMLQKIAGIDLEKLNQDEKEAYDRRRFLNGQLKEQSGRITPFDKSLIGKDPVSVTKLTEEFNGAMRTNHRISDIRAQVNTYDAENDRLYGRIKELQQEIDRMQSGIKTNIKAQEELQKEAAVLTETQQEDIDALKTQIATAEETNTAIAEAKRLAGEMERYEKLEAEAKAAEDRLVKIRTEKEALIRSAELPAEGLSFDENGDLLIDGLPFEDEQIATSRKMIAGIQIASSMLGDMRYLHLDASQLDKESADAILEWAEAHDLQLCMERADWDGGEMKMVVYDESAKGEEVLS